MIWIKLSLGVSAWALSFNFVKDEVYMLSLFLSVFFLQILHLNFH